MKRQPNARPEELERFTIRLPRALYARLRANAFVTGKSMTLLIVEALRERFPTR